MGALKCFTENHFELPYYSFKPGKCMANAQGTMLRVQRKKCESKCLVRRDNKGPKKLAELGAIPGLGSSPGFLFAISNLTKQHFK